MANDLRLQVLLSAVDKATGPLKRILEGSTGTAKALKATRDQLKALKDQQSNIASFKKQQGAITATSDSLNAAQEKLRQLKTMMGTAGNAASGKFKNDLRKAHEAVRDLTTKLQDQRKGLTPHVAKLRETGIATGKLGEHEARLKTEIDAANRSLGTQRDRLAAIDKRQAALARARAKFNTQRQFAQRLAGTGAVTAASGAGALYGGARMLAPGVEFGASMSRVQALTRLSKDSPELNAIRDQAREKGGSTQYTAVQVADAQSFLGMAGFKAKDIQSAIPGLLDMATAGGTDLARTADIGSNILGSFGLQSEEMGRVADVLTKAFTSANTDLEKLGTTMQYVGPVARAAGMSLEQTAAMAGLLGNIGIQSDKAGTTLRAMVLRLAAPKGPASKAMQALSINAKDSHGNIRDLVEVLGDVATATEKMGSGDRLQYLKQIFGEEPAPGMAELLEKAGTGGITKFLDVVNDNQGAAAATAGVMLDNLKGDLTALKSAWQDFGIELEDQQDGWLRGMVQSLTEITRGVKTWARENPTLSAGLAKTAAIVAGLMVAIGGLMVTVASALLPFIALRFMLAQLGIRLPGIIGLLKGFVTVIRTLAGTMTGVLVGAIRTVGIALWGLAANPVALAIMAVIAAIAVSALVIYRYWEPIKAFVTGFWQGLMDGIAPVKQALLPAFTVLGNALAPLKPLWDSIISVLGTAWRWFSRLFEPIESTSKELQSATNSGKAFGRGLAWLINLLVAFIGEIFLFGANLIAALISGIASMGSALKNYVIGIWTEINAGFSGGLAGIVTMLINFSPLGAVYRAFAGVLSYLGIELPSRFTEFGGMIINGMIDGMASMGSALKNHVTTLWTEINAGFSGGLAGIVTMLINFSPLGLLHQAFAGVMSYLGVELPSRFTEFGGMIINGLISGLTARLGKVKDAISSLGDSSIGWFKEKLGISADVPVLADLSSVRKQINETQQLALGPMANVPPLITPLKSSPVPGLLDMGKKLATSSALALSVVTPPALAVDDRPPIPLARPAPNYTSQDVYHISIPTAPGMDARAVALAVKAEMARAANEKKARNRSKLSDLE